MPETVMNALPCVVAALGHVSVDRYLAEPLRHGSPHQVGRWRSVGI